MQCCGSTHGEAHADKKAEVHKNELLMALCCLIPILAIALLITFFRIQSPLLAVLILLLCPLMMVLAQLLTKSKHEDNRSGCH
ncbi:MAG: hypothetical protein HY929_04140 [Euryarchaeota archaeon]|nr:hypothetical protein [Euryarchaeota archaeon]